MGAFYAWSVTLGAVVVLVIGLYHLGYDVSGEAGVLLRGVERFLGQPLLPP